MVPNTLDLAEHGRLAINGILGPLDLDDREYERYCLGYFNVHPAYMYHVSGMVSGIHPKFVEALAVLRQMTGSSAQMDIEKGNEELVVEVPVKTENASYTIANLPQHGGREPDTYACEFRGHTAIGVAKLAASPGGEQANGYRIFHREAMRAAAAPPCLLTERKRPTCEH